MEERWTFERELWDSGLARVAGVDEVGRGPLAGPVTAAAVILPHAFRHPDVNDSKLLSPSKREKMAELITGEAIAWAVGSADAREIESLNILQAARLAMRRAVELLECPPEYLLVDAAVVPGTALPQRAIVKGDRLSASIAAASIVAKVTRDREMQAHHERWPHYNFGRHKGYGTAEHRRAIEEHGPCPIHRRTFRGVREFVESV